MSQALHTSSTGINAGQSQINVIANNVANINTTAYKSANMVFENLYSKNLSYGSGATKEGGGTNPKQIGLGVKVGGITRNFVSGDFVSTGRDTDLMISGNGFFVVQDADGKQYFTRDGVFSLDSAGNLVTQSGMKVVATKTAFSNASSDKTVTIPKTLSAEILGDPNIADKTIEELNNASITTGDVGAIITGTDTNGNAITKNVILTVPEGNPTIADIVNSFNTTIRNSGVNGVSFSADNGVISYKGNVSFEADGTTSNFVAQTGLNISDTSYILNETVELKDMVNFNSNNDISLKSVTVDENGIVIATYNNGSILTQQMNEKNGALEWKYITPQGVSITGADVQAEGASLSNSQFILELATMVNEEGLINRADNLWEWGANVGEVYYGMAGEMSFGSIETGGYEGSNVDIATELTNMIQAQRMIQMNSRVFSTASSVMETLAYLGQ